MIIQFLVIDVYVTELIQAIKSVFFTCVPNKRYFVLLYYQNYCVGKGLIKNTVYLYVVIICINYKIIIGVTTPYSFIGSSLSAEVINKYVLCVIARQHGNSNYVYFFSHTTIHARITLGGGGINPLMPGIAGTYILCPL